MVEAIQERPADLIRRYRTLCEANGIARANRVQLAHPLQAELADLQRRLLALLGGDDGEEPDERRVVHEKNPPPAPEPVLFPTAAAPQPATPTATIFTDGAAEGNPGPGGYCAIVRIPGRPDRELSGSSIHTTNNKMELSAAIAGLRAAVDAGISDLTVFSDSEYLVKGMTQWLADWERRGWKTRSGQPVKNQDLWEQLASLARGRSVRWEWVKGHAGHPENERCDEVATAAARRAARARPI